MNLKVLPKRERKRHPRRAHLRVLWALVAAVGVAAGTFTLRERLAEPEALRVESVSYYELQRGLSLKLPERLVYPYSVVPGGVAGPREVEKAANADPVVAEHYEGFNYRQAMLVILAEPKLAYVSYRIKDRIFYTKRRLQLAQGEKVITDGKSMIRVRCGNRIMDAPQGQISLLEPPDDVFNAPELPLISLLNFPEEYPPFGAPPSELPGELPPGPMAVLMPPMLVPPGTPPAELVIPPFIFFPPGGGLPTPIGILPPPETPPVSPPPPPVTPPPVLPPVTPPPVSPPPEIPPPSPVPEPATYLLIGGGLLALGLIRRRTLGH